MSSLAIGLRLFLVISTFVFSPRRWITICRSDDALDNLFIGRTGNLVRRLLAEASFWRAVLDDRALSGLARTVVSHTSTDTLEDALSIGVERAPLRTLLTFQLDQVKHSSGVFDTVMSIRAALLDLALEIAVREELERAAQREASWVWVYDTRVDDERVREF